MCNDNKQYENDNINDNNNNNYENKWKQIM